MKIIHQNGYTKEELVNWKLIVYRNLIQSAQAIVNALDQFHYQLSSEKSQYEAQLILNFRLNDTLDPSVVDAIVSVWKDPVTSLLLEERSSEFYLMDSAP
jgi:guanine nucleotide-binding protein subunit alpha